MNAISYSTARAHLAGTMNKVRENHEPVVITRRGEEETTFLLRSPANAQRLLRSIACDVTPFAAPVLMRASG